ncbi:hypothetical protein D1872_233820 [compost metagenome]
MSPFRLWSLFYDHMSIRTAGTKGADRSTASGSRLNLPVLQIRIDIKRTIRKLNV